MLPNSYNLNVEKARVRSDELREAAARSQMFAARKRAMRGGAKRPWYNRLRRARYAPDVVLELRIRYARSDDTASIRKLAALDRATVPDSPLLVVEVDGRLLAALSLRDGAVIADPFHGTQALVELLEGRASQIQAAAKALAKLRRDGGSGRLPRTAG